MDKVRGFHARRLARESKAREEAERLLEQKSLELFLEMEERQLALDALRESEQRYRLIVELSPDAILVESGGFVVFANAAANKLFRASETESLLGRSLLDLAAESCKSKVMRALESLKLSDQVSHTEEKARRLDGSHFDVSVKRIALTYGGHPATQMVARDISDRKKLERKLAYQATRDSLTGVINRRSLLDKLEDAMAYADRHASPVWVAFIDLDRFKQMNDRFGHSIGDKLLKVITVRLQKILRKNDVLGRYGGDEFVLLLRSGLHDHLDMRVIERMMSSVCEPVTADDRELRVTCSIGIATYPADGATAEEIMHRADVAMYKAKESGRNRFQFYNSEIHEQLQYRVRIETELMHALAREELYLVYQPQLSLRTGRIVGAEALLRWASPTLGDLTPDQFIPLAEQTSLINQIGAWVVWEAARQAAEWERKGLGPLKIAVNLSARQLNGLELLSIVTSALESSGLAPQQLELELTESLMMSDVKLTQRTFLELHRMGVKIAVDDFGTGYSSFVYLQRLPLTTLKIDREFVSALSDPADQSAELIIDKLIQLAHSLKLRVVAEGVESRHQLDILRKYECDEIQGYLHSTPQRANNFPALLQTHVPGKWAEPASSAQLSIHFSSQTSLPSSGTLAESRR